MRLGIAYFSQEALVIAKDILGKTIVRKLEDGTEIRFQITEVEAYCGEEDLACHASKGRTKRTEIMYHQGGKIYVYLIYGVYWMLNFVCGSTNHPQAILIRGIENISGPGRVGRALQINKSFYGEELDTSQRIWVESKDTKDTYFVQTSKRIGIDYAGEFWANKPWRFFI